MKAIKVFLHNYAHLKIKKTYNSYTKLDQDYLVAVVQAAPEFELTSHTWSYPFIGKLPYRGYYKVEDAQKEAKKLRARNYDVFIRRVRAFSTLNMLPDPLYSFMKQYEEWELVELIAHEQTHATIWVSRKSAFNEQLANFVGRQSTLDYTKQKYGTESVQHKTVRDSDKNARAFVAVLYQVRTRLDTLYKDTMLTEDKKREKKQLILKEAQKDFIRTYEQHFTNDNYKNADITTYNNALLATISLYEENSTMFEKAYEACGKNMTTFIDELKAVQKNPHKKDPFVFLQNMCKP